MTKTIGSSSRKVSAASSKAPRRKRAALFLFHLYKRLSRRQNTLIHEIETDLEAGTIVDKATLLTGYEQLRRVIWSRMIARYVVLPSFLIATFVLIYVNRPASQTSIRTQVKVAAVNLVTDTEYTFNGESAEEPISAAGVVTYNESVQDSTGAIFSMTRILGAQPIKSTVLNELVIPAGSSVKMERLTPGNLRVEIRHRDTGAIVRGSLITTKDATDTTIHFVKHFSDGEAFFLSLTSCHAFSLSQLYIRNFSGFTIATATGDRTRSSISSGTVHLLETQGDSIVLHKGDSLRLVLKNPPVKLSVSAEISNIILDFEATVAELKAGPEIIKDAETLDKMPSRITVFLAAHPYAWTFILALLPIFIPLLLRQKFT